MRGCFGKPIGRFCRGDKIDIAQQSVGKNIQRLRALQSCLKSSNQNTHTKKA